MGERLLSCTISTIISITILAIKVNSNKKSAFLLFYDQNLMNSMIKNFSVPQIQNMVRADIFIRVLLRFGNVRGKTKAILKILLPLIGHRQ